MECFSKGKKCNDRLEKREREERWAGERDREGERERDEENNVLQKLQGES
jgi:hypothetical protein